MIDPKAAMACTDSTQWTNAYGPSILSTGSAGRIDSLVINPVSPQRMWAGAPTGGIWRSLNGGQDWTPLGDRLPSMRIGAMAIDPINPQILYAGSSEGIYKSIDGGNSWHTFIGTTIGTHFRKILLRYPAGTSQFQIFAATNTGLWLYKGLHNGLLKSSPSSWKKIKSGWISGLVLHPSDSSRIYVGVRKKGVYRSKSGVFPSGDASGSAYGRASG